MQTSVDSGSSMPYNEYRQRDTHDSIHIQRYSGKPTQQYRRGYNARHKHKHRRSSTSVYAFNG